MGLICRDFNSWNLLKSNTRLQVCLYPFSAHGFAMFCSVVNPMPWTYHVGMAFTNLPLWWWLGDDLKPLELGKTHIAYNIYNPSVLTRLSRKRTWCHGSPMRNLHPRQDSKTTELIEVFMEDMTRAELRPVARLVDIIGRKKMPWTFNFRTLQVERKTYCICFVCQVWSMARSNDEQWQDLTIVMDLMVCYGLNEHVIHFSCRFLHLFLEQLMMHLRYLPGLVATTATIFARNMRRCMWGTKRAFQLLGWWFLKFGCLDIACICLYVVYPKLYS